MRDKAADSFAPLYDGWMRDKPAFESVLKNELSTLARAYVDAYAYFMGIAGEGAASGDIKKVINGALSPIVRLVREINDEFVKNGTPPESALKETVRFLDSPKNHSLPHHWISSHLFAAIASRLARGQKRRPSRGIMNDIKVISVYGPYVDALFIDNECASLLDEPAVKSAIKLKARIFCLKRSAEFLDYLRDLVEFTPQEIVGFAEEIYGGT